MGQASVGFGIYIHWPFCQSKCPYCDFNSHVAAKIDELRWVKAYLAELDRTAAETSGQQVASVFFGGGTPSLMPPEIVAAILDRIRARWVVANDWEVTLEANPGSVEAGRFRAFRHAGVNRVSMGIQALDDRALRQLGRLHSVTEARAAFDIARDTFDKVSFDLIYARQDQTLADWKAELSEALAMAVDHLSLYQLTVEPGTAFGDRLARGKLLGLPDEDRSADMYDLTQDLCAERGLGGYEVSNHARSGSESRHNLIYWRAGDYVGVGPGAHGRITKAGRRCATECAKMPEAWLSRVEARGSGETVCDRLSARDQAIEYLMMSMRLAEGMEICRFEYLSGAELESSALTELIELELVALSADRLTASRKGRLVLNAVIKRLADNL
jgi:putative oxygen-independent coproporphyrinogen III oxidase